MITPNELAAGHLTFLTLVFMKRPKPLLMKAEPVLTTIGGIHHITSIAADPGSR
jgi:hypothetical protein